MTVRDRRIENEWRLLDELALANPHIVAEFTREQHQFCVVLQNSPAWVKRGFGREVETKHLVRYIFPKYYPAVPLECYFAIPIFHPNVDASNGFACLWLRPDPQRTIADAIVITRAMMSLRTQNTQDQHVMQKDALNAPLLQDGPDFTIPDTCRLMPVMPSGRRRNRIVAGPLEIAPHLR